MKLVLFSPLFVVLMTSIVHAQSFNPTGTYTGMSYMTNVKPIGTLIECQGNIGVPFAVQYKVKYRNGVVTVNDARNIVRRGKISPGSRFQAKGSSTDFQNKWTYTVTGTGITKSKGTITEIIKRVFINDPLKRGCQYTYYSRNLKRTK